MGHGAGAPRTGARASVGGTLPLFGATVPQSIEWCSDDWGTTEALMRPEREVFGGDPDLDPATNLWAVASKVVRAAKHYTKADNGLAHKWAGRVHLNPPWSGPEPFVDKAIGHFRRFEAETIMVVRHDHTTAWYRKAWKHAAVVALWSKRVAFRGPPGKDSKAPPLNVAIFGFLGPAKASAFVDAYETRGHLVVGK